MGYVGHVIKTPATGHVGLADEQEHIDLSILN
jgi:hypothetical protein